MQASHVHVVGTLLRTLCMDGSFNIKTVDGRSAFKTKNCCYKYIHGANKSGTDTLRAGELLLTSFIITLK